MVRKIVPKMIRIVTESVFKRAYTRRYPYEKVAVPEGFRGRQVYAYDKCIGCGLCARDCPSEAIEMVQVGEKRAPLFHLERCLFCYQCAESCPRNAIVPSPMFELAAIDKGDLLLKPVQGERVGKG